MINSGNFISFVLSCLALVVSGCQHQSHNKISMTMPSTSICEIVDSYPSYAEKRVRLNAEYVTDNSFYSYFVDKGCRSKENKLSMENKRLYESDRTSVIEFVRAGRTRCAQKSTVCPVSAMVDIEGIIVRSDDGSLGIDVLQVRSYRYQEK